MSFVDEFLRAMVLVGEKVVSKTDVIKKAYLPNEEQRAVMTAAGFEPLDHNADRVIEIRAAGTDESLPSSYYSSEREGSGRTPEIRIGRGLAGWVSPGETIWLGTDGTTVFALKSSLLTTFQGDDLRMEEAGEELVRFVDPRVVLERARASAGPPGRRATNSVEFERNPWVREFARLRSNGRCEYPGCDYEGFVKTNGTRYIEVHHIESLADDGGDIIENVAAVCPNCHKRAHYDKDREQIRDELLTTIRAANAKYLPTLECRNNIQE